MTEAPPIHLHIPTPGDHYSGATGSAIMTVIHELARCHATDGGHSQIVVGRGTRHDYEEGECIEVDFPVSITRRQKLLDTILARVGSSRHYEAAIYRPALSAAPANFDGVIFLHNAPGALPSFRAAFPKAQLCLYAHNALFGTYTRREIQRVLTTADRVICVSQFLANDIHTRAGRELTNVRAVNNGVDIETFVPLSGSRTDEALPLILFIGRIAVQKGAHHLIAAARILKSQGIPFLVRIVGSSGFCATDPLTPYEEELRQAANDLGDSVQFQPFVDRANIVAQYQNATVFCVPSDWDEPCTLTVPEGLACGLPIVASRRGGIPEVGGDAVLYFDPPDADALATHLKYLLLNPEERSMWRAKARQRAVAISWPHQYRKLVDALAA